MDLLALQLFLLCLATRDPSSMWALLASAGAWATAGVMLWRLRNECRSPGTRSGQLVLGLALFTFLVMLFSAWHTESRYHSINELAIAGLLPVNIFWALMLAKRWNAYPESRRRLFTLITVTITAVAAAAIVETFVTGHRPSGPFIDSNVLAALLNAGLLSVIAIASIERNRPLRWIAMIVIAIAQAFTASRGANLALLAVLVIYLALAWQHKAALHRLLIGLAVIACAQLSTFSLPFNLRDTATADFLMRPVSTASTDASASARVAMWKSTLSAYWHEAPVTGTGLGTYVLVYPRYRTPADLQSTGERAHNDYLERLLEGGPLLAIGILGLGLVLPLALIVCSARSLYRKGGPTKDDELLRLGFALACLALGLHACVNFILPAPALGFLFALCAAAALPPGIPTQPSPDANPQLIKRGLAAIGLFSMTIMPLSVLLLALGVWLSGISGLDFRQREPRQWIELANIGAILQPSNPRFREAIVNSELNALAHGSLPPQQRMQLANAADHEIKGWLDSNRCDTHAWESLAQLLALDPRTSGSMTALGALNSALSCQPQSLGLRVAVSMELEKKQDSLAAYNVLRDGMAWAAIAHLDKSTESWIRAGTRLSRIHDDAAGQDRWQQWAGQFERRSIARPSS